MSAYSFLSPDDIIYGDGALEKSCEKMKKLGGKALFVTDETMVKVGYVEKVTQILMEQDIEYIVYDEIGGEPTDDMVEKGVKLFKDNDCDFIVCLGGGSPIDAGKAIGIMVNNPGDISDYMGANKIREKLPPLAAIPTTAGTGSEATKVTIITDTKNDVKMLINDPHLMPTYAIVDPELTMTVPPNITAATGIDALTHAIEAYTSVQNQPLTDNLALSAINRISNNLRVAWANGKDKEARNEMLTASLEAGMAFTNSSVTIVHGMSRPIGAIFHVAHGISNAVLLPACMEYAVLGAPKRFANVAKALGVDTNGLNNLEAARKGVEAVKELCRDVEIPSISGLDINKEEFMNYADKMASDALASGSPGNTARKPSKEELIELYRKSL